MRPRARTRWPCAGRNAGFGGHIPENLREALRRRQAFEDGRLLRDKLMATRAALGRLPAELFARTRARLRQAIDPDAPPARNAEVQLWLCATEAVGADGGAARLARAAVPEAARADVANAVALAACDAALRDDEGALRALESYVLRLPLPRPANLLRISPCRTTGTTCVAPAASRACFGRPPG